MISTMPDKEVRKLVSNLRKKWTTEATFHTYERHIEMLGMVLLRCSDSMTTLVQATIEEASDRQMRVLFGT